MAVQDAPSKGFRSASELEAWLEKNHLKSDGIWLKAYKRSYTSNALKSTEIIDALLCYGWITGQARKGTDEYTLWWICPRRKGSLWSKVNKAHAERLIKEKRMRPSGMLEVESARADGRWERAYIPQSSASLPKDFLNAVSRNRKANAFLKTLNKSNVYSIVFRLETATTKEKRKAKISSIIKMLEEGRKFH